QGADDSEKIPCSRPGCYELFPPQRRSPLKKFCCALCRQALRRVRQREARWQRRPSSLPAAERREPFRGPPAGFRLLSNIEAPADNAIYSMFAGKHRADVPFPEKGREEALF